MDETDHTVARPNRFEIDLDAIAHNTGEVRRIVGAGVQLFAALKGNAYGFGLLEVAETVLAFGADGLSVADAGDAVRLRRHGVVAPILLYGGTMADAAVAGVMESYDLMPTIFDLDSAEIYSANVERDLRVWVKVDVGAGRLGVQPEDAVSFVAAIRRLPRLTLHGIYTHMVVQSGGQADACAAWQFTRFEKVLGGLESAGIDIPLKMAASTRALLMSPDMKLNAVDPGHMLYGLRPPAPARIEADLRPAFHRLVSRLIQVKPYSRTEFVDQAPFPIREEMRIGVVPMGLSDGMRLLNCGSVLVRGRRAPLLGQPSLEHTRVDLTEVPGARAGDEVVIIGSQGDEVIPPEEVIARHGLKAVEPALEVGPSVSRVYRRERPVAEV